MDFLKAKTGPLPNWAWGAIIVVGMGIGIFIMKRQSTPVPEASQEIPIETQPASQGYDPMGSNGHEVVIIPLGNYSPPPQDIQRSREPVREVERALKTRARFSIPGEAFQLWDKNGDGVPVRAGTSGGTPIISRLPYNSTHPYSQGPIEAGTAVEQKYFQPGDSANLRKNTIWYRIKEGYINGLDVEETVSVPVASTGNSSTIQQNSSTQSNT
jgi:hypothetical protein